MSPGSKAGANFFRYRGRSMWPVFQEGDLLEVQSVAFGELRVGDCITYYLNNSETLVSHRINAIRGRIIFTHGDAFSGPDDLSVGEKQIIGRVISRYRLGGLRPVSGGLKGLLAGGFYHYIGRLDPQRKARGGCAARLLRSSLQWLSAELYRRGTVQEFGDSGKEINYYWLIGQRCWAKADHTQGGWLIPWPQSLIIDPDKLPSCSQRQQNHIHNY